MNLKALGALDQLDDDWLGHFIKTALDEAASRAVAQLQPDGKRALIRALRDGGRLTASLDYKSTTLTIACQFKGKSIPIGTLLIPTAPPEPADSESAAMH